MAVACRSALSSLGLELLSHLDGDRAQALNLFGHAKQVASLAETFGAGGLPGGMASAPEQAPRR